MAGIAITRQELAAFFEFLGRLGRVGAHLCLKAAHLFQQFQVAGAVGARGFGGEVGSAFDGGHSLTLKRGGPCPRGFRARADCPARSRASIRIAYFPLTI